MKRGFILSFALLLGCSGGTQSSDLENAVVRESVCTGSHVDELVANVLRLVESGELPADLLSGATDCAGASDCASYLRCRGFDTTRPCDATTTMSSCVDATHVEQCAGPGLIQTVECDPLIDNGGMCLPTTTGATCGAGTCTSGASCDGSVTVNCDDGIEERLDCSRLGQTCAADATNATCVDVVEACTESRCEGDDLLECEDGLGLTRLSCARVAGDGGTCSTASGSPACVAATMECAEGEAGCVGSIARHCVNGIFEEVDCSAFLGATCRDDGEGFFGRQLACVTP